MSQVVHIPECAKWTLGCH